MLLHQNKDDFKTLVSLVSDHNRLRDIIYVFERSCTFKDGNNVLRV